MTRQNFAFSWKSQSRMVFQFVEAGVYVQQCLQSFCFHKEGLVHILSLKLVCAILRSNSYKVCINTSHWRCSQTLGVSWNILFHH